MIPDLIRIGARRSPVVVVDDFTGDTASVVDIAAALAPFAPLAGSYYPGLRRIIEPVDSTAHAYATRVLEAAAPFIGGAFGVERFDWIEASFSMVTTPPADLGHAQRAPHFDSIDPRYLAILHYLGDTPGTGTAFFRQRATGIEAVDAANRDAFVAAARAAPATTGYIHGSDGAYEQVGAVEARADRLVIYQGCLLHSGIIPPGMALSADPRVGRLTANLFVQGY